MSKYGRMAKEHLEPAKSIIAKCGGPERVSKWTQRSLSRVYRWMYPKERGGTGGNIPFSEAQVILLKAQEEGIDLHATEFFSAPYSEGTPA